MKLGLRQNLLIALLADLAQAYDKAFGESADGGGRTTSYPSHLSSSEAENLRSDPLLTLPI